MRVVIATDGSAHASAAVEWLTHFPLSTDTRIGIVTAAVAPVATEGAPLIR
jgi:hypothetical protein